MDPAFRLPKRAAKRSGGARELALRFADTLAPRKIVFDENREASYVPKPLKDGVLSGPTNRFGPFLKEEEEGADLEAAAGAAAHAPAAAGAAAAAPGVAPAEGEAADIPEVDEA